MEDVLAEVRVLDALDLGVAVPERPSAPRTCCTVAAFCTGVVIRVPDSKSMPSLRPSVEFASAPARMIMPDIEKNQREAPMKSKCQPLLVLPGLIAQRERRMRRRLIVPRIAE